MLRPIDTESAAAKVQVHSISPTPMIKWAERSFVPSVALVALFVTGVYYSSPRFSDDAAAPVHGDGIGYFVFLPAAFVQRDLTFRWLFDRQDDFHIESSQGRFAMTLPRSARAFYGYQPNLERGTYVGLYSLGTSLLIAPFWLLAHIVTLISSEIPNGWTFWYQLSVCAAGIFYMVAGLFLVRASLRKHFGAAASLAALLAIVFGTNLFHYGTVDASYSHVYSFFLFSAVLYLTPKWLASFGARDGILLGLACGLIPEVRLPNGVFLLIIPLYGIGSVQSLKDRLRELWQHRGPVLLVIAVSLIGYFPQLLYWKLVTGNWLYYSYKGVGFHFDDPHLLDILFGVRKGLFFWFPVLVFALPGILLLRGAARAFLFPLVAVLAVDTYLISSWWCWWYGWSYGPRPFVETLPLFAVGLASLYGALDSSWMRRAVVLIGVILVALTSAQSVQYWLTIQGPDETTWTEYKKRFLKFDSALKYHWRHG